MFQPSIDWNVGLAFDYFGRKIIPFYILLAKFFLLLAAWITGFLKLFTTRALFFCSTELKLVWKVGWVSEEIYLICIPLNGE